MDVLYSSEIKVGRLEAGRAADFATGTNPLLVLMEVLERRIASDEESPGAEGVAAALAGGSARAVACAALSVSGVTGGTAGELEASRDGSSGSFRRAAFWFEDATPIGTAWDFCFVEGL